MASPLAKSFAFFFVAAALLSDLASAQPFQIEKIDAPLPLTPLPMHTAGRMLTLKNENGRISCRYQWPGIYFTAAFTGPDVYFETGRGDAILHFLVDDQPAVPLVKPGAGVFRIGGLSGGAHTIRVEVVTESQGSPMDFGGFALAAGRSAGVLLHTVRQIEFIGDSHTVGYGNTSMKRQCTPEEIWATTDNSLAFGPLTAKHYHADYQINAISGRGIVRNYNGGSGDPLPVVYPYVLFDKHTAVEDKTWQPQIIVVALGTNDFSTPLHDGEKWKAREELHADFEHTYVHFVQQMRAGNPGAFFILAANDMADSEIQREVRQVVGQLEAAGEKQVAFAAFNNLQLTAADWHPSLADHEAMSTVLRQLIDARPELWPGR
jgi:lysophospholipase L1-like esterase